MSNPPVNLAKIAMGDGTMGNNQVYNEVSTVSGRFCLISRSNPSTDLRAGNFPSNYCLRYGSL